MSGSCSGEQLTALVDGALDPGARDRVLRHLAGCTPCRAEVDQLRRLKARLSELSSSTPAPPPGLVEQLRSLAVPGADPLRRPAATPPAPGQPRAEVRPGGAARPARAPSGRRRRRSAVGGGLVAAGAVVALLVGSPSSGPGSTPVDPGSDAFVVDFVSTTGGVPLADPAGAAVSLPTR